MVCFYLEKSPFDDMIYVDNDINYKTKMEKV
jgi:hypothetical protein